MNDDERFLVLSALGPDRPGLVAEVTDFLTSRGANIEESRMAVLGGDFGMLILLCATADEVARMVRELPDLEKKTKLSFTTKGTKSPEEHRRAAVMPCLVRAESLDNEGIVRSVAMAIHEAGINIVSMETSAYNAPVTGSPLFRLEAELDVPQGMTIARVRELMARVAAQENIDVEVRSLSSR
jgi:glycine cleavage system transcriptional repressor